MARQLGIMRVRGRLGNIVGYLARDGKGDKFDAIRDYGGQFSNPQTIRQMDQRMKMAPVVNFYRGLSQLLDHSWQTVMYGQPSRLFFYSQCMSRINTAGCPYLLKGDKKFVPWNFPISSGSIAVPFQPTISNESHGYINIPVVASTAYDQASTVADFTADCLTTLGITEGMQMTFIWVFSNGGQYIPVYRRIILDSQSTTPLTDLGIVSITESGDDISLAIWMGDAAESENVVASGVIISKLVGNTWQRNTATMVIVDSLRTQYNSQAAYDAMLESYRTTVNTESDYYLNEGQGQSVVIRTVQEVTVPFGASEATVAYYQIGSNKYVPTFRQTPATVENVYAYRKAGDYEFTKTNAESLGSASSYTDTQEEFAALGYTICTAAELRAIAPELIFPA